MKLFCFVGAPGSGKSTRAVELFEKLKQNAIIIERDEVREMLTGKPRNQYRFTKENEDLISDAQVALIKKGAEAKRHIIISDTNLSESRITMLKNIAKEIGYEFVIVDMFLDFLSNNPQYADFSTRAQIEIYRTRILKQDLTRTFTVGEQVIDRFIDLMHKRYGITKAEPDESLPKAIVVDIDGTLAHMYNRSPYDGSKMMTDTVDPHVLETINLYRSAGYKVIVVTGRFQREVTIEWLDVNGICYDAIYSRDVGDRRPDHVVKEEIYFTELQPQYCVKLILDDRGQVVRMWRALGLKCYQVENTEV